MTKRECWTGSELAEDTKTGAIAGGMVGLLGDGIGYFPGTGVGIAAGGLKWAIKNYVDSALGRCANTADKHLPSVKIDEGKK